MSAAAETSLQPVTLTDSYPDIFRQMKQSRRGRRPQEERQADPALMDAVAAAGLAHAEAWAAWHQSVIDRREAVLAARAGGASLAALAKVLDCSTSAVGTITRKPAEDELAAA